MKKAMIALATVFLSLGAWQLLASGGASAVTMQTTIDLTFTEGFCSDTGARCKVVGDQNDPFAFGNRLVFTIPISSGGTNIGYEQGECVYLQKASSSDYCSYDLHLSDGVVSVQGTLPTTSTKNERTGKVPVTGGTRAYLGAYGTLQLIAGTFDYELKLVIP